MSCKPGQLTKGTDVWRVQTTKGLGVPLENPVMHHGIVTGGGEIQVVITWDMPVSLPPYVDRENRLRAADRVSLSESDAWAVAAADLAKMYFKGQSQMEKAYNGLFKVLDVSGGASNINEYLRTLKQG